jgi:hypothetical protein
MKVNFQFICITYCSSNDLYIAVEFIHEDLRMNFAETIIIPPSRNLLRYSANAARIQRI